MIAERYLDVLSSVFTGARGDLSIIGQEMASNLTPKAECRGFNALPEDILPSLDLVIRRHSGAKVSGLKGDLGVAKAEIMVYFASFADMHNLPEVDKFSRFAPESVRVVEMIEQRAEKSNNPLSLGQQLEIALGVTNGDVTKAVLALAIGTRAMARSEDRRIVDGLEISRERIKNWKKCVKAFGYGEGQEDTAGDTYHFWHGVLAGMSREEKIDTKTICRVKQFFCDLIYTNTAKATEILRHKLFRKEGETHWVADIVGYNLGRAFMQMI